MPESQFFEYTQGAAPDGTPRPLSHASLEVAIPTMVGGNIARTSTSVELAQSTSLSDKGARIVPGTRLVEVNNALLVNALNAHPHFVQVDTPKKAQIDKQVSELAGLEAEITKRLNATATEQEDTAPATGAVSIPADIPSDNEPAGDGEEAQS